MGVRVFLIVMRLLARVPLSWVRAVGWLGGWLLYAFASSRRHIATTNLSLCFPHWSKAQRSRVVRLNFIRFAQALLDRSWLWHAPREVLEQRLQRTGDWTVFDGDAPTVVFAPHFQGLDAGGMALSMSVNRRFTSIYSSQRNAAMDEWVRNGRSRFGDVRLLNRFEGVKPIVSGLRQGGLLYLLPDMDLGAEDSVFVPFYGVMTATVPSLSRFARLGRAQVVPLVTRMTPTGYEVCAYPAWKHYPTDDAAADAALMNVRLEEWIDAAPDQYWWVHKRFKTRPPGEPGFY